MPKIYERNGNEIYEREFGDYERTLVAMADYANLGFKENLERLAEVSLWKEIFEAAKTNPALQAELDRVKVTWALIKDE